MRQFFNFIWIFMGFSISFGKPIKNQVEVLLEFKRSMSNNSVFSNWIEEPGSKHGGFCNWNGVKCDAKRVDVVVLNLSDSGLEGTITPKLGLLTHLSEIDLSHNFYITGSIPSSLGNCSSLSKLHLYGNSLSGPIPHSLGQLQNLTELFLWGNKLTGSIPSSIGHCLKLHKVNLFWNDLSGPIPDSLGQLQNLIELDLSDNNLTGMIPPSIGDCAKLQLIDLGNNLLTGPIPDSLGKLQNLIELDLSKNNLTSIAPSIGPQCSSKLQILRLSGTQLSGSIPSTLGNCSSLTSLSLGYNFLTGPIPDFIGKLHSLTTLDLSRNNLSASIPATLGNLSHLSSLGIAYNSLIGTLPDTFFSKLRGLQHFDASYNSLSGSIHSVLNSSHALETLYLDHNNFSGEIPSFKMFRNLTDLRLDMNRFSGKLPSFSGSDMSVELNDNFLEGGLPQNIFNDIASFFRLDLSNNSLSGELPDISSRSLFFLNVRMNNFTGKIPNFGSCDELGYLDLSENRFEGDMSSTVQNCTYLASLNIAQNNLSGEFFLNMSSLPYLKFLALSRNNFTGSLKAETMTSSTSWLQVADYSSNSFSGEIPQNICGKLLNLTILSFSFNKLSGEIPTNCLSFLPHVQVLDVSNNNLSGQLPEKFQGFMAPNTATGPNEEYDPLSDSYNVKINGSIVGADPRIGNPTLGLVIVIKGITFRFDDSTTLADNGMTILDVSCNSLSGNIPPGIGSELQGLIQLNMSHNHFTGNIPTSMPTMKKLQSLDLSGNQLQGPIPNDFGSLSFSAFNISYNNLSGEIPGWNTRYPASSFEGNILLCGFPTNISCHPRSQSQLPTEEEERHGHLARFFKKHVAFWPFMCSYIVTFGVAFLFTLFWGLQLTPQ